jgi:hypothetical protein
MGSCRWERLNTAYEDGGLGGRSWQRDKADQNQVSFRRDPCQGVAVPVQAESISTQRNAMPVARTAA